MSIRIKIILALTAFVVLWAVGDTFLLRPMLSSQFEKLANEEVDRGLERVERSIADELRQLRNKARLLATLPDVEELAAAGRVDLVRVVFEDETLREAGIDLLYVCGPDGAVRWGRIEDPESRASISVRQLPSESLSLRHPLLGRTEEGRPGNLLLTDHGVILACALPVRETGSSPAPDASGGYVVMGRFLEPILAASREGDEESLFRFELVDLASPAIGDEEREFLSHCTANPDHPWADVDAAGNPRLSQALFDVFGNTDLVLRATVESRSLARGARVTNYLLLSTAGMSILIFLVLLMTLQRIVIQPLSRLTGFAAGIAETDDTEARINMVRSDEIGILASEFDRMLEEIEQSRRMLVVTARRAGMSEIATGVLHNVGNVLNSVNVSATMLSRKVAKLDIGDLSRLVTLLEENEHDLGAFVTEDPRGRHLLPFLRELAESATRQKETILDEARVLHEGMDHIAELVRSQQSYAGGRGVLERANLADEINAAIKICRQAYGVADDVEIRCEFDERLPEVSVDRHKLMEILVNLIQNARQAIEESGRGDRTITLRTRCVGEETARIEVEDTGVGIPDENLEQIFQHGFTTKETGHGFGLHVSANAAGEMNSSLRVRSDGPGRGAVFLLDIPVDLERSSHAA